jgi:hypothetical protein
MLRALVVLVILGILTAVGLLGYSYTGLVQPDREPVTEAVEIGRD